MARPRERLRFAVNDAFSEFDRYCLTKGYIVGESQEAYTEMLSRGIVLSLLQKGDVDTQRREFGVKPPLGKGSIDRHLGRRVNATKQDRSYVPIGHV